MRNKQIVLASIFLLGGAQTMAQKSSITLEDLWKSNKYSQDYVWGINSMNDGKHYSILNYSRNNGASIEEYDYATQSKQKTILTSKSIGGLNFNSYQFNADETKILLPADKESIYRHSFKADFHIYDRESKKVVDLEEGKQMLATFSPNSENIAYVSDNNLYYKNLQSKKTTQITQDGKYGEIINGAPDWVYEEEFSFSKAFAWNADGTKIAYYKFNEKEVPLFSMDMFNQQLYPDQYVFKYPKAGEKNATVSIWVYDLKENSNKELPISLNEDFYIPRIKWTKDPNKLSIQRLNRHQNNLDFIIADAKNNSVKTIFQETDKAYVEVYDDLTFLPDGKHFIWSSEKDGFRHLYLYDLKGKEKKQITKGNWEVTEFYGYNPKSKTLFYQSAEHSPLQRSVYSIKLNGKSKRELTPKKGTHNASFSNTFDYFIDTYTNARTPNFITLRNKKGKVLKTLKTSERLNKTLEKLGSNNKEFTSFTNSVGEKINGYLVKPKNFDKNKKYPVFMYLYGGPGSQQVLDSWGGSNYMWFQMLADKGYIVACFDNRGTGARGRDFKKVTYLELGKYETEDQIEANRYLASLPYVDGSRIGIFGWSYGGFMSSNCLFQGNDVFKMAIAVAPVTNWRYYDSIYTERYMRTPQENQKGYDNNSPIFHADKLKGKYLLVHGTADDNVHYQNAIEMVSKLISENKDFDSEMYPDKNHGIYGGNKGNTRLHLYNKMTNFIINNL
jgi:dipeptidyl-peptidase-4